MDNATRPVQAWGLVLASDRMLEVMAQSHGNTSIPATDINMKVTHVRLEKRPQALISLRVLTQPTQPTGLTLMSLVAPLLLVITMITTRHLRVQLSALLALASIHQLEATTIHAVLVLLEEWDRPGLVLVAGVPMTLVSEQGSLNAPLRVRLAPPATRERT